MGDGIAVECPVCSTKRTFLRGVGMEYSSIEKIFPQFDSSETEYPRIQFSFDRICQTHLVIYG